MAVKRRRESEGSNILKGVEKTKNEVDGIPKVGPVETTLANLPNEIIIYILAKLPINSVFICKSVCKGWHSNISNPYFAELYFEYGPISALVRTSCDSKCVSRTLHLLEFDKSKNDDAKISDHDNCGHICSCENLPDPNCDNHIKLGVKFKLPLRDSKLKIDKMLEARKNGKQITDIICKPRDDKFDIVNSSHGLLCLCDLVKRNPLVVCNPITGEFIRLPQSKDKLLRKYSMCGFGYLKKTNEYKVIRMYDKCAVEIHTLGTGLWRSIKYQGCCWTEIRSPTCLNESLHWLIFHGVKLTSILRFDLEGEVFNSFPCPTELSAITNIGFGEFKGCLYIYCHDANTKCLKFWIMKTYGDGKSWTEVLNLNTKSLDFWPCLYQPFGSGILICDPSKSFIYYDPQKHLFRFFESRGTAFALEPIFIVPSLIKLKDAVKGDDIEVLNVHSR